jgi:hypothetical protein
LARANRGLLFLSAASSAAVAVPVTILLHELGHFGAARSLGFRDVRLHAFTTEYTSANYPETHRFYVAVAGLAVTVLLTVVAGTVALRWPRPPLLAICLAAPARGLVWIPILVFVAMGRATVDGGDEVRLARLTRLPLEGFVAFSLLLGLYALGATLLALRQRPKPERAPILLGLFVGLVVGWLAYSTIVPRLLS